MQRGIVLNEGNRRVILDDGDGSEVYRRKPYTIRTLDPAQERSISGWSTTSTPATPFSSC